MSRAIASPGDQSATFVELFLDLVFVFGITQIVGLLHHDMSWAGVGHAVLVFWLVWWAWTQFTWALVALAGVALVAFLDERRADRVRS